MQSTLLPNNQPDMPGERFYHQTVVNETDSQVYLYGGMNEDNELQGDLYCFNANKQWSLILPTTSIKPEARYCHAMCMRSNKTNLSIIILGGYGEKNKRLNDMWEFDIRKREWSLLAAGGDTLAKLTSHTILYHDQTDSVFLFGGSDGSRYSNDVMQYSFAKNKWSKLKPKKNRVPIGRFGHSANWKSKNEFIVFGGGGNTSKNLQDSVVFNIKLKRWTKVSAKGQLPAPRNRHGSVVVDNALYIFGGAPNYNDFFQLDFKTNKWRKIKLKGDVPCPRAGTTIFSLPSTKNFYVFGGDDGKTLLGDFYEFNASSEDLSLQDNSIYTPTTPATPQNSVQNPGLTTDKWGVARDGVLSTGRVLAKFKNQPQNNSPLTASGTSPLMNAVQQAQQQQQPHPQQQPVQQQPPQQQPPQQQPPQQQPQQFQQPPVQQQQKTQPVQQPQQQQPQQPQQQQQQPVQQPYQQQPVQQKQPVQQSFQQQSPRQQPVQQAQAQQPVQPQQPVQNSFQQQSAARQQPVQQQPSQQQKPVQQQPPTQRPVQQQPVQQQQPGNQITPQKKQYPESPVVTPSNVSMHTSPQHTPTSQYGAGSSILFMQQNLMSQMMSSTPESIQDQYGPPASFGEANRQNSSSSLVSTRSVRPRNNDFVSSPSQSSTPPSSSKPELMQSPSAEIYGAQDTTPASPNQSNPPNRPQPDSAVSQTNGHLIVDGNKVDEEYVRGLLKKISDQATINSQLQDLINSLTVDNKRMIDELALQKNKLGSVSSLEDEVRSLTQKNYILSEKLQKQAQIITAIQPLSVRQLKKIFIHNRKWELDQSLIENIEWQSPKLGSYSNVYRASYKGEEVAVKRIDMERIAEMQDCKMEDVRNVILNEMFYMVKVVSQHVVKPFGACFDDRYALMVMEWCQSDLASYVRDHELNMNAKVRMLVQIAQAMTAIHKEGIAHRDLTPRNILMQQSGIVKVIDFGTFLDDNEPDGKVNSQYNNIIYVAPERITSDQKDIPNLNAKLFDVYGFGLIMYYILSNGFHPYHDIFLRFKSFPQQYVHYITSENVYPNTQIEALSTKYCPPHLVALMEKCYDHNPVNRMQTFDSIILTLTTDPNEKK